MTAGTCQRVWIDSPKAVFAPALARQQYIEAQHPSGIARRLSPAGASKCGRCKRVSPRRIPSCRRFVNVIQGRLAHAFELLSWIELPGLGETRFYTLAPPFPVSISPLNRSVSSENAATIADCGDRLCLHLEL
jgi:hypothetical protein